MSSDPPFDAKRRLCPDGACVGVLGPDGRCGVCGRSAGAAGPPSEPPTGGLEAVAVADDEGALAADSADEADGSASDFDPSRRLCEDGSCVGVIGPDGVCGTCGTKWS